jgi:hypothetical protein
MIPLGTIKGLLATAEFFEASGAFTTNGRPYAPSQTPPMPVLNLNDPPYITPQITTPWQMTNMNIYYYLYNPPRNTS